MGEGGEGMKGIQLKMRGGRGEGEGRGDKEGGEMRGQIEQNHEEHLLTLQDVVRLKC